MFFNDREYSLLTGADPDVEPAFLGIDPGKSGGLAIVSKRGAPVLATKMPETLTELKDVICGYWWTGVELLATRAIIEHVNTGVFRGDRTMGVVSAGTFMRNVGHLEMALVAAEVPFERVVPIKWQNALGCRTRGDKNISKARALELFPGVPVTHAIADALLLAEYCRRLEVRA